MSSCRDITRSARRIFRPLRRLGKSRRNVLCRGGGRRLRRRLRRGDERTSGSVKGQSQGDAVGELVQSAGGGELAGAAGGGEGIIEPPRRRVRRPQRVQLLRIVKERQLIG